MQTSIYFFLSNACTIYTVVLHILVTITSHQRNFFKFKLLKTNLQSAILQNKSNSSALISIKNIFFLINFDCENVMVS